MAIEIIPRKTVALPSWLKILFYVLIGLIIISILSYFILGYLQKKSLVSFKNIEEEISKERTSQRITQEEEILNYQKKINDFEFLLSYHLFPSKFFTFLEKTSHPRVLFSQTNLNPAQSLVTLSGQAESFLALGQQLQILKREPSIKNVSLSKISLGERGGVDFTLTLSFDTEFFK